MDALGILSSLNSALVSLGYASGKLTSEDPEVMMLASDLRGIIARYAAIYAAQAADATPRDVGSTLRTIAGGR